MAKVVNLDEFSKPMKVSRSLVPPHRQVEEAEEGEKEDRKSE